ncbi:MAG TPA: hypothetical protein V6D08_06240 [Candidatus Obscuribacterales bacterium]
MIPQAAGYPFLKPNHKASIPPGIMDVVDYKAEKDKVERHRNATKARSGTRKLRTDAEALELMQAEQPREDWSLLKAHNILQGYKPANKMHAAIQHLSPSKFKSDIVRAFESLSANEASGLSWKTTLVQLFTPSAAKGYCRIKPDRTKRNDNTKEDWADPFVEWLKFRGYFLVACAFHLPGSDIRLLCPVPSDISVGALQSVSKELRKLRIYGRKPKVDSLSVLGLAEILIRHSEEFHDPDAEIFPGLSLRDRNPAQAVSGVQLTHYQSMGNSKAVSGMATLALPGWFSIRGVDDARVWLETLQEHQRVVRSLKDDRSDEIGLLLRYRKFLEQRGPASTWKLIEFMETYGAFLLRAREQDKRRRIPSFRADLFRRLVMESAPRLTEVFTDPGFTAVAAAVRKATVSAQAQKAMGRKDYREIRYDLLPDLRRKRSLPGVQPFIQLVADFVSKYNSENGRRREMGKPAPRNVTTEEFESFVRLVEKFGASTVGALLCAYGSCREPDETEESVETATAT